jgi:hypothetical protein
MHLRDMLHKEFGRMIVWKRQLTVVDRGCSDSHGVLVVLVVLTLALLNPLACLIHCAAMEHAAAPVSNLTSAFLCDLQHTSAPGDPTPTRAPTPAPRAVYPGVMPALVLFAAISLARFIVAPRVPTLNHRFDTPPTPPPRLVV